MNIFSPLVKLRPYRQAFRADLPADYTVERVSQPHYLRQARQLQASVYLDWGYITHDMVTGDGVMLSQHDPEHEHADYFVVTKRHLNHRPVVATARQVTARPRRGHASFPVLRHLQLYSHRRAYLEALRPDQYVEISALARVAAEDENPLVSLSLYRYMWHHSLRQQHRAWLMACDARLYRRLRALFGAALVQIGPRENYMGSEVIPAMLDLRQSLNYLLTRQASWHPKSGMARFFLRDLPAAIDQRPATPLPWFIRALWYLYGYTYDGLRAFYPYRQLIHSVYQRLDLQPGQTILDMGCGTGNLLEQALKITAVKGIGIDVSASMLAQAKHKLQAYVQAGRVVLLEGDLRERLRELPSQSFDCIASVNVFYALTEREAVWQELMRLLKPGGRIVVTSSVRTGSGAIIKEHLDHAPWWQLLRPRLVGVYLMDALINLFGNTGQFEFPSQADLRREVERAGGVCHNFVRCYGGSTQGVNVLFTVTRR